MGTHGGPTGPGQAPLPDAGASGTLRVRRKPVPPFGTVGSPAVRRGNPPGNAETPRVDKPARVGVVLGPCPCQRCRRAVTWNGWEWQENGRTHSC